MFTLNPIKQPLSARNSPQVHSKSLKKYVTGTKTKSSRKKKVNEELLQSISPWCFDQFNHHRKLDQQLGYKLNGNFKPNNQQTPIKDIHPNRMIINIVQDNEQIKHKRNMKKRTNTQSHKFQASILSKIKLHTVYIADNFNSQQNQKQNKNKKYFSQEAHQRKMSMTKFRQTLVQTTRTKFFNTVCTEDQECKKLKSQLQTQQLIHRKLKTLQIQNQAPLMFYFQAKNNKNMTRREKNIMKIRKIGCVKQKKIN